MASSSTVLPDPVRPSIAKISPFSMVRDRGFSVKLPLLTEKLWKHLEEVDRECNDMMDMLTVRMAEREGVTEHLKSVDQLGWVRKMNNIRSRAEEVVLHDMIYMD